MSSGGSVNQRLSFGFLVIMVVVVCFIWPNRQLIASQNFQGIVADLTPKGWHIYNDIEQFTPENLYEQINGRASFFLAYDMVKMTYVSFVHSIIPEQFVDLSIYNMGTCTLLKTAWPCDAALPNGSMAIITTGVILPLTTKPRMRFTTAYPIRSHRQPDA